MCIRYCSLGIEPSPSKRNLERSATELSRSSKKTSRKRLLMSQQLYQYVSINQTPSDKQQHQVAVIIPEEIRSFQSAEIFFLTVKTLKGIFGTNNATYKLKEPHCIKSPMTHTSTSWLAHYKLTVSNLPSQQYVTIRMNKQ